MHGHAARELLAFYAEAGVDALLGEEPMDRLSAARDRERACGRNRARWERPVVPAARRPRESRPAARRPRRKSP